MADHLRFVAEHLGNLLIGFPQHRPGGLLLSILLSTAGIGLGLGLALVLGPAQLSPRAPIRWLVLGYGRVIRGIPLILLLLLVHQFLGTGRLGVQTSSLGSALITLVLYASAYQADIVAAGLRAVPVTLVDEARTLGASATRARLDVALPYGLRVMRPALVTQAITVFKDSSAVVVLGVADLTTTARIVLGSDVANAPFWLATYLTVGALYFTVAVTLSRATVRAGRHGRTSGLVTSTPSTS